MDNSSGRASLTVKRTDVDESRRGCASDYVQVLEIFFLLQRLLERTSADNMGNSAS